MVTSLATGPPDNTNLRRRRQSGSEDEGATKDRGDLTDSSLRVASTPSYATNAPAQPPKWPMLLLLLHACAVGVYVWGWILRIDLHTSVECDMTYSLRQLIPIPLPVEKQHAKYGLYKFIDQRDPRSHHRDMMQRWLNTIRGTGEDDHQYLATKAYRKENEPFLEDNRRHHCTPSSLYNGQNGTTDTTLVVLYIPGHWGSYMQSRSIGAHGIQLTGLQNQQRVLESLTNNLWKGLGASDMSQFGFDVYAIDFQEEGAALHAQFLWVQTAFVANAIQHIVDTCQLSQVILLGHSIGGYVARLVPVLYPHARPYISNVITLGTPHTHPVFGWESSVHHLHETYLADPRDDNQHTLVAISGGIRDEMIPPVACQAPARSQTLSVLSTDIMEPKTRGVKQLGMDHRAIVWCHNLLSVVRGVIYALVRELDKQPQVRIESVQKHLGLQVSDEDYSYDKRLQEHQSQFMRHYGFGATIAMESAMLYHLEVLVGLFVVLGCFQCAGLGCLFLGYDNPTIQRRMRLLPLVTTICLATRTNYELHWLSLVVLTLVANVVLWILQWILGVGLPNMIRTPTALSKSMSHIRLFSMGIFFLLLGLQTVGKLFAWKTRFCTALLLAVYISTLCSTIALSSSSRLSKPSTDVLREDARLVAFTSTFFLVCPCIVTGKIVALLSTMRSGAPEGIPAEYLPDTGLVDLATKLLLPIILRLGWLHFVQTRPDEQSPSKPDTRPAPPSFLDFLRALLMSVATLYFGPSLFQMGQGYRAGELLIAICWLECFMHSLYVKLMD